MVVHGVCRCLIKSMPLHSPPCKLSVSTQCLCTHCIAVKLCTYTCVSVSISPCADKYVCIFYDNIRCYITLHYVKEIIFFTKIKYTYAHHTYTILSFKHRNYAFFSTHIEFIGKVVQNGKNIMLYVHKCLLYIV